MPRRRRSRRVRIAYRWLALSLAGLGALGLVLPLVPGAMFLIASVWAANRSSPALAMSIRRNRHFGPVIHSWEQHGAIPLRAKVLAVALMSFSAFKLWWFDAPTPLLVGVGAGFLLIAGFLLSRPAPPKPLPAARQPGDDGLRHEAEHRNRADHGDE